MSAMERMKETGVWKYILPEVKLEELNRIPFKRIPIVIGWWEDRYYGREIKSWVVYLLAIFAKLTASQLAEVFNRYPLDRYAQRCIEDSVVVPQLADKLSQNPDLRPSQIDKLLAHLGAENVIYLLLHLREESVWDRVVSYCDLKERAQVEISGHDLKQLGLKPGPLFKKILAELYDTKLDLTTANREEELAMVRKWMKEGTFIDAMVI
jgi:tRNA nucleotidyltransferase (CCA-adding enzyme)